MRELLGIRGSDEPNAEFVDVGYDTVLVARFDMDEGTEVFAKYSL